MAHRSAITFVLLLASASTMAAPVGEETFVFTLTLFLHQALFVFWLGPDIGVYMWSTKLANSENTPAQRIAAARMMPVIEVISKGCMSLMLTVGGVLTQLRGIDHYDWQMPLIILLGPIWLTLTLLVYFRAGTALGEKLARMDVWFRWLVVASVLGSVVLSVSTGRLAEVPWVTAKLMLFAAVVLFGLLMRTRLKSLPENLARLENDGPSSEVDGAIAKCIGNARIFMFASWICLLAAGALGTFQPGTTGSQAGAAEYGALLEAVD